MGEGWPLPGDSGTRVGSGIAPPAAAGAAELNAATLTCGRADAGAALAAASDNLPRSATDVQIRPIDVIASPALPAVPVATSSPLHWLTPATVIAALASSGTMIVCAPAGALDPPLRQRMAIMAMPGEAASTLAASDETKLSRPQPSVSVMADGTPLPMEEAAPDGAVCHVSPPDVPTHCGVSRATACPICATSPTKPILGPQSTRVVAGQAPSSSASRAARESRNDADAKAAATAATNEKRGILVALCYSLRVGGCTIIA
jgi:hypothetical protein